MRKVIQILLIRALLVISNIEVGKAYRSTTLGSTLALLVPPSTNTSLSSSREESTRARARARARAGSSKTRNLRDFVRSYDDWTCRLFPAPNGQVANANGDSAHANAMNSVIVRGGARNSDAAEADNSNPPPSKVKKILIPAVVCCLAAVIACNRDAISQFNFKEKLASDLDYLASKGTPGLIMYTLAFMLWEITVGVTTPVETAAGMAFGLKKGFVANVIGKTSGAITAFLLGRYVLKDAVEEKLEGNEYMELVQDSIVKTPVRVALIWRFSFLPEQIKNFGLAVLPVKTWQFASAVCMHGIPFTLLWTFLGNEMGMIVRGVVDSPSRTLKLLISGVYVFGFFISPSLVGMWVKGLRDEKLKKDQANE